jgi:hypothetical protein
MTTPPQPPAPAPPAPAPPAPTGPPPAPPAPTGQPPAPPADPAAELRASLEAERRKSKDLETELAKLRQQGMTDAEKAIEAARAEGRAEAEKQAALRLVAAEFRIAATGKLANPDAALAALDLAKLLDGKGEPDTKAITALVDQLAAVPPAPPPGGHIPPGPRTEPPAGDGDWLRQIRRTR